MNKKLQFASLIFCLLFCHIASAQTVQLFQEGFNEGNATFILNSGGPASNTGSNRWIVNNQFNGYGIYPNTTKETHTNGDTISLPDSNYMHIYDTLFANAVSNCSYNTSDTSDNFTYMAGGFCTHGFSDVHFTFFYIAQGDSNSYGTVYYTLNDTLWIPCGALKYHNDTVWTMEDISLPDFENNYNLQFGFRWTNSGAGGPNKMSFGIDDIAVTATYKPTIPLHIVVTSESPDTICSETILQLGYKLSLPFCDGSYQVVMSDATGNFTSPDTMNLGTFTIASADTVGFIQAYAPFVSGTCFKFRIDRASTPYIKGTPGTACVVINECQNTISTIQPVITYGPDTVCTESAIDVPFWSTGTFNSDNTYIAQLSDANGSFAHPQVIGSSVDNTTYDPYTSFFPGNIAGALPPTTPGCNYYIRVISSSPSYISPSFYYYGPFCIHQCDITTNNGSDTHVCIGETVGGIDTISFKINSWNKNIQYNPGNEFVAQLVNPYSGLIITSLPLGMVASDTSTKLVLNIPANDSLFDKEFLFPGTYYLRVISTNSSSHVDTLGSVIRLTIGFSDPTIPTLESYDSTLTFSDSIFCIGYNFNLFVNNINLLANYQWQSSIDIGLGDTFLTEPPLEIHVGSGAVLGRIWFLVREDYYGCFSPWSDTVWVRVINKAPVNIAATSTCREDTVDLSVARNAGTTYSWSINGNQSFHHVILDNGNEIKIAFDSIQTYKVTITANNQCGSNTGSYNVNVSERPAKPILNPTINGVHDTIAYNGNVVKLYVTNYDSTHPYIWASSFFNNGHPFSEPSPFDETFTSSSAPGLYYFIAREYVNGCYSDWSDTVWINFTGTNGIAALSLAGQVSISPNPTANSVLVIVPETAGVNLLQLTDITGRVIKSQEVTGTNIILNMEELPAAVYFIRLTGKESGVFKVVKQ